MDKPGKVQAAARLDEQEHKLNKLYNGANHTLVWNRKTGKDPKQVDSFGKLSGSAAALSHGVTEYRIC